jgi:hypothetical protein
MTHHDLQARVDEALATAIENGYDMVSLGDAAALATDLLDCNSDFEQPPVLYDDVVACCDKWLGRQRSKPANPWLEGGAAAHLARGQD